MQHLSSRQHLGDSFPLRITEVRQEALEEHSHEFFEMVYVRRGHGLHIFEGRPHPIRAGDLYVISPDETHGYAAVQGGELHIINVLWLPSLVEDVLRAEAAIEPSLRDAHRLLYIEPLLRRETRFANRLRLSGSMAYRVETLLDEMRREQTLLAPGCQLLLRHLFCTLLVLLSRAHETQSGRAPQAASFARSPQQEAVARALEYIEENSARSLRVDEVAAHVALSPGRLAHLFKQQTGRSVIAYLHEFRIARACSALQRDARPVQEIAAAAGYDDLRFFRRMFQRHTGCSPSDYRRQSTPGG
jgi:AraC-like DNA-binding protein/mannose-6-phosphate isomerase-like protein (cupin superfamily)